MLTGFTILLACIIGFAVQRAGFCSVRAVEEILTTKRAYMLTSFVKLVAWVVVTTWLIGKIVPESIVPKTGWQLSLPAMIGGAVLGLGATINGGCAFSTLTRLGSGNIGMLTSLGGFIFGLAIFNFLIILPAPQMAQLIDPIFLQQKYNLLAVELLFGCWVIWELFRFARAGRTQNSWAKILAPHYRLSTAALLMGVSNAILYAFIGLWPFTNLFRQSTMNVIYGSEAPPTILWVLFIALIVGIGLSAWQSQQFRLQVKPRLEWISNGVGGFLMGVGASMIPGGNDILVLHAIPSFSEHAIPAFIAMLLGIAVALCVFQLFGQKIPLVSCKEDICKIDFDRPPAD